MNLCRWSRVIYGNCQTFKNPRALTSMWIRNLFSGEELGIKNYSEARKVVQTSIPNALFFKQRLGHQISNKDFSLMQLEYGLKNLLHLMENTPEDISLLEETLQQLILKRKDYEGDKYRFDTIIMRMFYFLGLPDEAMRMFDDPALSILFNQVTSYQILLDLLYEHQKYDDVLYVYLQLNLNRRLYSNKYIDVIILATYYRLNTPEHFESAYNMWNKMLETGKTQFRKSRTFVAGLAVKQNRPEIALKILEGESMYVSMRHIKMLAWAQTGKFTEVLNLLSATITYGEQSKLKPKTSVHVLQSIENKLLKRGTKDEIHQFAEILKNLKSLKRITNESLDDILCAPFPVLPQSNLYHKKDRPVESQ